MSRWNADGSFGLLAGCAAVVGAAFVAALMFTPTESIARLVVMAAAVLGVTAATRDWRAAAGAAALAVLVFVGFLVNRDGVLTGNEHAWADASVLPAAALAGWTRRLPRPKVGTPRIVAARTGGGVFPAVSRAARH
jgi:hypothetical protein